MPYLSSTAYAATTQFRGNIGAMIIDADPVVKFVMLILFIFSVFSWGIVFQKWLKISRARTRGQRILDAISGTTNLVELLNEVKKAGDCPIGRLFHEAQAELKRITVKSQTVPLSMMANVENRIVSMSSQHTMELSHGIGFLASISNASPFIGLFGTVWGIMNAFREIGLRGTANLATVAPGISEALIATAAGLFVAIPAVLFYNYFTGLISQTSAQMEQFQIEFMNWIRRGALHADK